MTERRDSPFQFLDPYEQKDKDKFFGRNEEVEKLYDYINKNRIVLIYGTSGTGKTSLVQCGLANRLDDTDWKPFFIRRGNNINKALYESLLNSEATKGLKLKTETVSDQLIEALAEINSFYLRPVFLIFDQFEELLILGNKDEKEEFTTTLCKIMSTGYTQSCSFLFILREEYFAWLDNPFEKKISGFSDRRLRLEPMKHNKIVEVIHKSCKKFNITLEDPDKNAEQIYDILSGKTGISLPYLQVYLDQLWREDYKRTFPDGWEGEDNPPLEFTTKEIEAFGQIIDVLDRFLSERKFAIQQELKSRYENIAEDMVSKVLDSFVTDEGTKLPVNYTMTGENISLTDNERKYNYLHYLPADLLTTCLQKLEKSRILRTDGESYELAHDILASLIDQQRSDEQRRLNDIRNQIRSAYHVFQRTQEYLTSKQVVIYEDAIGELKLDEALKTFFEESKDYREDENNKKIREAERIAEEQREMREQAEQSKLLAQRKAKQAKTRTRIAIMLALICFVFLIVFYYQKRKIQESNYKAQNQSARTYWYNSQSAINENDFLTALHFTAEAFNNSLDAELNKKLLYDIETYLPLTYLKGFFNPVIQARFKSDGKQILAIGPGNTVRLWDTFGKLLCSPMKHEDVINTAVFNPAGDKILTASADSTARLWDISGKPIGHAMIHPDAVSSAVFSPDGKRILTGCFDGFARLWDATGKRIDSIKHESVVISVAFSPDGKKILTACSNGKAYLWNAATLKQAGRHMSHIKPITVAVFSPNGKWVLTASEDRTAHLWDTKGKPVGRPMKHEDVINTAVFNPAGDKILTASRDRTARLWDISGNPIGHALEHEDAVTSAFFSPDGKLILTASLDRTAKLWDATTGKQVGRTMKNINPINIAFFDFTGKQILTISSDSLARLWQAKPFGRTIEHEGAVNCAVFSPDGKKILTASSDSTARIWNANTREPTGIILKHKDAVYSAVFDSAGKRILTASLDNTACLWDTFGRLLCSPMKHKDAVYTAVFDLAGKRVLTASEDSTARLWDISGKPIGHAMIHPDAVSSAVFSPDGKRILTGCFDGFARLWDTTGKQIDSIKHESVVISVAFSPDGRKILTACFDSTARLWNADPDKKITLKASMLHENSLYTAAFDLKGEKIITTSLDRTARLWDTTGKQMLLLKHKSAVYSAFFSPDGKKILTASFDKTVHIWHEIIDEDIPPDLFKLQAIVLTGSKLDTKTNEVQAISNEEWQERKKEFFKKASAHYKECRYKAYNLWGHLPAEVRKSYQ